MALGISRTFGFEPLMARSRTFRTAGPISAEDCARLIFVRAGSVLLHNELGVQQANVGDVITLGSNAMFGYEPEGFVTVTTICLDLDYVIDQVFWQHAAKFTDRLEGARPPESRHGGCDQEADLSVTGHCSSNTAGARYPHQECRRVVL